MLLLLKKFTLPLAAALFAIVVTPASAITLTGEECGNKWIGLSQDGAELTAELCTGRNTSEKNSTGANSPIIAAGWTDAGELSGNGSVNGLTVNGNNTWSYSNSNGYTMLGISIKQGNGFAFYLLDLSKNLSGMWGTGNNSPDGNDFSGINVWYMGGISQVPLPAGGVLLLTGLAGLGFASRRKRG